MAKRPCSRSIVGESRQIGRFEVKRMDKDESALNPHIGMTVALILGIILGSASLNLSGWSSIARLFHSDAPTALPENGSP